MVIEESRKGERRTWQNLLKKKNNFKKWNVQSRAEEEILGGNKILICQIRHYKELIRWKFRFSLFFRARISNEDENKVRIVDEIKSVKKFIIEHFFILKRNTEKRRLKINF